MNVHHIHDIHDIYSQYIHTLYMYVHMMLMSHWRLTIRLWYVRSAGSTPQFIHDMYPVGTMAINIDLYYTTRVWHSCIHTFFLHVHVQNIHTCIEITPLIPILFLQKQLSHGIVVAHQTLGSRHHTYKWTDRNYRRVSPSRLGKNYHTKSNLFYFPWAQHHWCKC